MLRDRRYWQRILIWAGLIVVCYAFWRWGAGYVMPFMISALLAVLLAPLVAKLQQWGLGRMASVVVVLASAVAFVLALVAAMVFLLTTELIELSRRLPKYVHARPWHLDLYLERWNNIRSHLGLGRESMNSELRSLYHVLSVVLRSLAHLLVQLPELGLMTIVALVAGFLMLRDYGLMILAAKKSAPPRLQSQIGPLTTDVMDGIVGFLRAEMVLVSVTGLATMAGLLVIRAPYAVLIGLTAGLLDMVPFMGPTVLLVPWAGFAMLVGKWTLGVHLLMVLGVVALVRQVLEPRLVGHGTGLHPVVVLFSLYMGIRLFGAKGVIIGPLTAVMLNAARRVLDGRE